MRNPSNDRVHNPANGTRFRHHRLITADSLSDFGGNKVKFVSSFLSKLDAHTKKK